jgi:hypothetical protein
MFTELDGYCIAEQCAPAGLSPRRRASKLNERVTIDIQSSTVRMNPNREGGSISMRRKVVFALMFGAAACHAATENFVACNVLDPEFHDDLDMMVYR